MESIIVGGVEIEQDEDQKLAKVGLVVTVISLSGVTLAGIIYLILRYL